MKKKNNQASKKEKENPYDTGANEQYQERVFEINDYLVTMENDLETKYNSKINYYICLIGSILMICIIVGYVSLYNYYK